MELQRPTGRICYITKGKCTGCGECVKALPEVFALDEHQRAEVHNPYAAEEEQIQAVMNSCEGKCILWRA